VNDESPPTGPALPEKETAPAARERRSTTSKQPIRHAADASIVATRRRAASRRVPPLSCGCADPWPCRCAEPPLAAYPAAAMYLLSLGLTPSPDRDGLRAMWRAGAESRRAAGRIATVWGLT
jgi:hypothetical protein